MTMVGGADWIRGVNIGGWLLLERYISPYLFAVTDCHLHGALCWYPGQAHNASTSDPLLCNLYHCRPHFSEQVSGEMDYPIDEYTLSDAFLSAHQEAEDGSYRNEKGMAIAEEWLNVHFENFIQEADIAAIAASGVTHIRIPLPHWILEGSSTILADEPWIAGGRWAAFGRLCVWARKYKLQVWPDIHTAPGSQNGFDNSGQTKAAVGCTGWSSNPNHVQRSLDAIEAITSAIARSGYDDVVTGFGLLNEPFLDCDFGVYKAFVETGLKIVRSSLGPDTAVYVSDMFRPKRFNDGHWWLDPTEFNNTYLDSHYYHVFAEKPRELSPRQHIAFTCQHQWREAVGCCYEDAARQTSGNSNPFESNSIPSTGVGRIFGEWSVAYDTLPVAKLAQIMQGIQANGTAPEFDRKLSNMEMDFMRHFARAQIVAYESIATGTSSGWFYWTAKMEGGAFAEWDFLRGVREGWMPAIADPSVASESVYGTCYDILFQTSDESIGVIEPFPDPSALPANIWQGPDIDDDVVVSHGKSLLKPDGSSHFQRNEKPLPSHFNRWLFFILFVMLGSSLLRRWFYQRQKHAGYTSVEGTSMVV